MIVRLVTALSLLIAVSSLTPATAGFVLSVDPGTLQFDGPGTHTIGVLVTHDGSGATDLSGYTIRFGTPANASVGTEPLGVDFISATEVLDVSGGGLFSFNDVTNTVAASNLAFGPFSDVGLDGTATLFTLDMMLGAESSYEIGVDFQNAQRGGLFATQIGNEFFSPNSPTTDFAFVLTNNVSAIPEPSSIALLGLLSCGAAARLRNRSRRAKNRAKSALVC